MLMYTTILFDLDGTLTDPAEGITNSVRHALAGFGIEVAEDESLIHFIGPPLKESFMQFYNMTDSESTRAVDFYREYFSTKGIYENRIYPGIKDLLEKIDQKGLTLSVATSKPTVYAKQIIEHFGLSEYFQNISGSNLDHTRTDKGEVIAHALEALGSPDRKNTLMIGDRRHDIIGAKKNSVDAAGVLYGYGSREELSAEGPEYIFATVEELASFLLG